MDIVDKAEALFGEDQGRANLQTVKVSRANARNFLEEEYSADLGEEFELSLDVAQGGTEIGRQFILIEVTADE